MSKICCPVEKCSKYLCGREFDSLLKNEFEAIKHAIKLKKVFSLKKYSLNFVHYKNAPSFGYSRCKIYSHIASNKVFRLDIDGILYTHPCSFCEDCIQDLATEHELFTERQQNKRNKCSDESCMLIFIILFSYPLQLLCLLYFHSRCYFFIK